MNKCKDLILYIYYWFSRELFCWLKNVRIIFTNRLSFLNKKALITDKQSETTIDSEIDSILIG